MLVSLPGRSFAMVVDLFLFLSHAMFQKHGHCHWAGGSTSKCNHKMCANRVFFPLKKIQEDALPSLTLPPIILSGKQAPWKMSSLSPKMVSETTSILTERVSFTRMPIPTWRIIPFSKWLITLVTSPYQWPKWLIYGGDPNYLRYLTIPRSPPSKWSIPTCNLHQNLPPKWQ